jgi:chromosome segregation ATPase
MKKLFILSASLLILISCNENKIEELSNKNSELSEVNTEQDEIINEMLASFNEIQANLNQIKKSEGFITINTKRDDQGTIDSDQINRDISLISKLMKKNEDLIGSLNSKLDKSNIKISEFRKLIKVLTLQVEEKNVEIARLNELLSNKNLKIDELYFSIDSLNYSNRVKDQEIQDKVDQINTGYYAYGTFKELKEKNVLTKEGGVLGLGKSQTMKDNFNKEYFSKVDITKQKSFLIYSKKAELITTHPTGSYEFVGADDKVDSLVIINSEDFWRASKYMVIVVD